MLSVWAWVIRTTFRMYRNKRDAAGATSLALYSDLAGRKPDGWHPLVTDFILVARKLQKLGLIHSKGKVIIIDPGEL